MNQEMTAEVLLRAAARLVDKALAKIDSTSTPCRTCGHPHWTNREEARIFQELANLPPKLRAVAHRLADARQPAKPAEPDPRD